jgi:hypothetical protein
MTAASSSRSLTVSDLLFGSTQDTAMSLTEALRTHDVLSSLDSGLRQISAVGREAAYSEVASAAREVLDLDLGELLVAGWRKPGELAAAAERTAADPSSSEVVELAPHRITSVHRPLVELLVDDVLVASLPLELQVELQVRSLVATVRHGDIVGLRSGSCEATATLAAEGRQLARSQDRLELPRLISLPLPLGPRGGAPSGVERIRDKGREPGPRRIRDRGREPGPGRRKE